VEIRQFRLVEQIPIAAQAGFHPEPIALKITSSPVVSA